MSSFSDAVILWNFSTNLEDSIGGHNLSALNTTANLDIDPLVFKRGTGSLRMTNPSAAINSAVVYLTHANLPAASIFKASNGVTSFTMCGWFRPAESNNNSNARIFSKWYDGAITPGRSLMLRIRTANNNVGILWGINAGANGVNQDGSNALVKEQWYHATIGYDTATNNVRLLLWDDVAGSYIEELESSLGTTLTNSPINIGFGLYNQTTGVYAFNGHLDEWVVFNRYLSTAELALVVAGTYGASSGVGALGLTLNRKLQT